MATSEVRELQVVGEINHNIELYNLDELISEDEISEGVDTRIRVLNPEKSLGIFMLNYKAN